jgi:hypothetical protein
MVTGRWWQDETAEIDVLGMIGDTTALIGECRWQSSPLAGRDLAELYRKAAFVPKPTDDLTLMFWTRSGTADPGFPATVYSASNIVE